MRPLLVSVLAIAASGCSGILGIPSEGQVGCPEPCTVTVSGKVVIARAISPSPLAGVKVRLTTVTPQQETTSAADGSYSFTGLAPGTPLKFDLSFPQIEPDPRGVDTQYTAGVTPMAPDLTIDLPLVEYRWLAAVAQKCQPLLFPTLNDALFEPGTTNVNSYFKQRSTVVGQVLKENADPATSFDRADVTVALLGPGRTIEQLNFQGNPDSMMPKGTTLCFLEPNTNTGEYEGSAGNTSTTGRFVMFRVQNDVGTGTGNGAVKIPNFPQGPLDISAGSVGFARIRLGDGTNEPARKLSFARDVYHWFADVGCADCHTPGGSGFEIAPTRFDALGNPYRADWSAAPNIVYDNLTKPLDTNCGAGGSSAARVCKAVPAASLLYINPTGMGTHPGINNLPTDHPMMEAVLQWITDEALP